MGRENWELYKEMDENGIIEFKCKHFFNRGEDRIKNPFCEINKLDCPVEPNMVKYECKGIIGIYWTELIVKNDSPRSNLPKEVKEAYEIP